MRVSYSELHTTLTRALAAAGVDAEGAALCAGIIADASRDGVASHGLNLAPRLLTMIRAGTVDPRARAVCIASHGALERWDGRRGIGALNAHDATMRAIGLARAHGIGAVALGNTNHWMRGGTYGWLAAGAGVVAICWTNTLPNLPPWGGDTARIGNNPLVIAVPRESGHVVLDMALSQFSYGALAAYRARGETLPVDGGFDAAGRLTRDPAAIEASGRPVPIGSWKGSGLSIVLDLIAAVCSGGLATHQIPADPEKETGLSQMFIAIDPSLAGADAERERIVDAIVASVQARYPGQRTLDARRAHLAEGIPVDDRAWEIVRAAAG